MDDSEALAGNVETGNVDVRIPVAFHPTAVPFEYGGVDTGTKLTDMDEREMEEVGVGDDVGEDAGNPV